MNSEIIIETDNGLVTNSILITSNNQGTFVKNGQYSGRKVNEVAGEIFIERCEQLDKMFYTHYTADQVDDILENGYFEYQNKSVQLHNVMETIC